MRDKELFLESAKEAGIKIENQTIAKVSNYSQAIKFFDCLRNNRVQLGMDMASGTCSGNVEVLGEWPYHICLMENDNKHKDIFKFGSMVIITGNLSEPDYAPEVFIESVEDLEWLNQYGAKGYCSVESGRYLGLEIERERRIIYDAEKIHELLDLQESGYDDQEIVVPSFYRITRNTKRELAVYINVQASARRLAGDKIVHGLHECDDLIHIFSSKYKII